MNRRSVIKLAGATALTAPFGFRNARAQDATIKIGVVGPKTGVWPAAPRSRTFRISSCGSSEVNARGGLKLKTGQKKVELIEYDDRSQPGETIKAVERLATQDKVDFIMPVYGTGFNLAAAPIFAKYGYPQVAQAAVTDQMDALIQRYPKLFFVQGSTTSFAQSAANVLKKLKDEGKIGNKVAIVNVADAFGIELANAGRPIFKQAGFEIVYDRSYPLGTQDLSPVMKAAKAANPDAFVAWSYPPDTFALAGAGQDRRPERQGLLQRGGDRVPGASAASSALRPRTSSAPAASRTARRSATTTSATRRSPASMPTTGAARCTTRSCRFSSRRSKASARSIARPSPST